MTAPGLLYYFGDKDGLLRAVVEERQRVEVAELYGSADEALVTVARLPEIARSNAATAELVRLYLVLATESLDRGEPLHDFFVQRFDRARRLTQRALANDVQRGLIRGDVDLAQIAREVQATLIGLELQWLMDPGAGDYVADVTAYVEGLLERLRPVPPAST